MVEIVLDPYDDIPKGYNHFENLHDDIGKCNFDNDPHYFDPTCIEDNIDIRERFRSLNLSRISRNKILNEIYEDIEFNKQYSSIIDGHVVGERILVPYEDIFHNTEVGILKQSIVSFTDVSKCITPTLRINKGIRDRRQASQAYKELSCKQYDCPACALENRIQVIKNGLFSTRHYQELGMNFVFLTLSADRAVNFKALWQEIITLSITSDIKKLINLSDKDKKRIPHLSNIDLRKFLDAIISPRVSEHNPDGLYYGKQWWKSKQTAKGLDYSLLWWQLKLKLKSKEDAKEWCRCNLNYNSLSVAIPFIEGVKWFVPELPKYFQVPENQFHSHIIMNRQGSWKQLKEILGFIKMLGKRSYTMNTPLLSSGIKLFTDIRSYKENHWTYVTKSFSDELAQYLFKTWNKKGQARYTHSKGFFIPMMTNKEMNKSLMKVNNKTGHQEAKLRSMKNICYKNEGIREIEHSIKEGREIIKEYIELFKTRFRISSLDDVKRIQVLCRRIKAFIRDPDYILLTFWQQLYYLISKGIDVT